MAKWNSDIKKKIQALNKRKVSTNRDITKTMDTKKQNGKRDKDITTNVIWWNKLILI